jgi:hypothetical protein
MFNTLLAASQVVTWMGHDKCVHTQPRAAPHVLPVLRLTHAWPVVACGCLLCCSADLVARAGQLGEEGDVDGAMAATQQAESLGKQHETLYKQLTEPERTMTVCDICGVFINSTDNEQRRMVSGGRGYC